MGTCNEKQEEIEFSQLYKMTPVPNNDELLENLNENKEHQPSRFSTRRVTEYPRPKQIIIDTVEKLLQQSEQEEPIKRGALFPVYYVKAREAFYFGEWKVGNFHGKGKIYFKNGCYYQGPFKHGQLSGRDGILVYPDGSYKRGKFKDGKLHGKGKMFYKQNQLIHEGEWRFDRPHGQGIERSPFGVYEGNFVQGLKEDECGVMKWQNGIVYEGSFKNGKQEGLGKMYNEDGEGYYEGTFKNGLKTGSGKMKTEKGLYEGSFKHGQMSGFGMFTWKDGKIYKGEFRQNQIHGEGTIFYPNGQIAKGYWENGCNMRLEVLEETQLDNEA